MAETRRNGGVLSPQDVGTAGGQAPLSNILNRLQRPRAGGPLGTIVAICVVFTLGYFMGYSSSSGSVAHPIPTAMPHHAIASVTPTATKGSLRAGVETAVTGIEPDAGVIAPSLSTPPPPSPAVAAHEVARSAQEVEVSVPFRALPPFRRSGDSEPQAVSVPASLATTFYGRGNVSGTEIGGTKWLLHSFPLADKPEDTICYHGAPHGGKMRGEFMFKMNYIMTDRMNDRSTQEPSLRFVHYVHALPDQPSPVEFPHINERDMKGICASVDMVRFEFLPKGGCPGKPYTNFSSLLLHGGPWCVPWHASVFIAELTCGFGENCYRHGDMSFMVISENGAFMSHKRMITGLPEDTDVREFDVLASPGYTEYADAPGHFQNELLPRLLHLDNFLPVHIPLLWPAGSIPDNALRMLQDMGFISRERQFVRMGVKGEKALYRAKKMYFYGTTEPLVMSPVITWFSQYYLASRYRRYFADALTKAEGKTRNQILVLRREPGRARSLTNHDELMAALRRQFPDRSIEDWLPTADNIKETGETVYSAALIVAVHGANLNNIMFARRGTSVVEVGFLQGDFHWPSDYMCLARNLGLHFWGTLPVSGNYGSPMTIDVEHMINIVKEAMAAANPVDGWQ